MKKERIPNGIYTKEFREEALKLITEGGLSINEVGRILSVGSSTIAYWVKAQKAGKLSEVGKTQRPLSDIEMENKKSQLQLQLQLGSYHRKCNKNNKITLKTRLLLLLAATFYPKKNVFKK